MTKGVSMRKTIKIQEVTSERQFLAKLRTFYRSMRKKGASRQYMPFLNILEHTGPSTKVFDNLCERYFSIGGRGYDWQQGNSLLQTKIDEWEKEIQIR